MKIIIKKFFDLYKEKPKELLSLFALIVLIVILFVFLPDIIVYDKGDYLGWIPFFVIFIVIPWLASKILSSYIVRRDYLIATCFAIPLILGPLFGILLGGESRKELKLNGEIVKGVVYKKSLSYNESEKKTWLIRCYFNYRNKKYSTFSQKDTHNQFEIGDSLEILFSKKNPENNKILKLNEKQKQLFNIDSIDLQYIP